MRVSTFLFLLCFVVCGTSINQVIANTNSSFTGNSVSCEFVCKIQNKNINSCTSETDECQDLCLAFDEILKQVDGYCFEKKHQCSQGIFWMPSKNVIKNSYDLMCPVKKEKPSTFYYLARPIMILLGFMLVI
eukprot:c16329_g1_i2.p1 GENE.c16329_g1_i2~~c16329_g1_i2.p1  ORF type:complete len:132 (+),score=23.93 c16329_g1_i2:151-546(+)